MSSGTVRQGFHTLDQLRLEIEGEPSGLRNLIENPSGEFGGFGWRTPSAGVTLNSQVAPYPDALTLYSEPGGGYVLSDPAPCLEGHYAAARGRVVAQGDSGDSEVALKARIVWLDADQQVIGQSAQSGAWFSFSPPVVGQLGPQQAPAGTVWCQLRLDMYGLQGVGDIDPSSQAWVAFNEAVMCTAEQSSDIGMSRTSLVPNPNFDTDLEHWSLMFGVGTLTRDSSEKYQGSHSLKISATGWPRGVAVTKVPVVGGRTYTVSAYFKQPLRPEILDRVDMVIRYVDADGDPISSYQAQEVATGEWQRIDGTMQAPHNAAEVWVQLHLNVPTGYYIHWDAVLVEESTELGDYFDGSTPNADGWSYSWGDGVSLANKTTLDYLAPVEWIDILSPATDIKVTREALNTGVLTATVRSATLDPSVHDLIRPGRKLRLVTEDYEPLFMGEVSKGLVTYDYKTPGLADEKRARIELTAVDAVAKLANVARSEGVATIDELPYVLEGAGVPWVCNGNRGQVPGAVVVAVNENASALDQVAVTRDSVLGHAWADRWGFLQARDAITSEPIPLTQADYSDIDLSYDTERCINEVRVDYLRFNPSTLETETVSYGPFRDEASIYEWGVRSATFVIQGIAEEVSDLEDFAQAVLAANGTPEVVANSVLVPVKTTGDVSAFTVLDVNDLLDVEVPSDAADSTVRIVRIEHDITPSKWLLTLSFEQPDSVAAPTFTPSPNTGAGGKTIGQLLRPVGEVTSFYCAKVDIPQGWLALDGSSFSGTEYPELAALLGGTTLPDFTDRFVIGAGTKSLGSTGGTPTKTLATTNLPSHTHGAGSLTAASDGAHQHTIGRGTGTGGHANNAAQGNNTSPSTGNTSNAGAHTHNVTGATGSTGSGTPLDIMPPWVAVWPCIRAR